MLVSVFVSFLSLIGLWCEKPVDFDEFFVDKILRLDYFHIGDAREEWFTVDKMYEQDVWAGHRVNLVDTFNNGRYYVKVYDLAGQILYSKGFDSYFGEYKTTDQAMKGVKKTCHETALIPYPKRKIRFTIEQRDRKNVLHPVFSQEIDPSSIEIIREKPETGIKVFPVIKNGNPHHKVDLAFIAEGYTAEEESKFQSDLKRFAGVLFGHEPYKSHRMKFNLYGLFKASAESGCDEPRRGVFRNTTLNSSFNSLGSERYLLTEDNRSLRHVASVVPYDALIIMVNHKRYGGGGIYNFYCLFTVDNQWSNYLLVHELGHSFAGLADEYYTSSVAYNQFYPRGVEPLEPNITALLDPESLKWKKIITPGVEIPTPWEKEEFDLMDKSYQEIRREINAEIAWMKREGHTEEEIEKLEQEAERLSLVHSKKIDEYLARSKYKGMVGAFEGAGYSSQGLYRPMLDCIMFTKGEKTFCKVCEQAIIRVIRYLSD
jgi:hypothetical protein